MSSCIMQNTFSLEIIPSKVQWKHIAKNEVCPEGANNLQRGIHNDPRDDNAKDGNEVESL